MRSVRGGKWRRWLGMNGIRGASRFQVALCSLSVFWLLWLAFSSVNQPQKENGKHSRSLLAASTIKGRLDAIDFDTQSAQDLRAIIRTAISPGFKDSVTEEANARKVNAYDPTFKFIESVAAEIVQTEQQIQCPWDPTVELDLPSLGGQKYLLAANFRNNEALLPHVIVQLWHLLAVLPEGSTFVSVYESGSTDSTGAWLEILRQLLSNMKVAHRIVIGGTLTRAPLEERIDFLAKVRNAALEPLWLPLNEREGNNTSTSWFGAHKQQKLWPADKIVFFNDVYFCARDAIRLLLHKVDMACGMDFDRKKLDQVPLEDQQKNLREYLRARWKLPGWVTYIMSQIPVVLKSQAASLSANEFFRRALPLGFYDLWVGRDMNGAMFLKDEPYATDPYTLGRLPKGLPFPVKCCWNGLVALDAKPFTIHNVRIRSHKKGECAASECSLLCNDFLRLGYHKMLVDPGVRQAYNVEDVQRLYKAEYVKGIKLTSWADVTRSPPIDSSLVPFRPYAQCCGLKPGNDMVDFKNDCSWENVMSPNYTAAPYALSHKMQNSSQLDSLAPRRVQKLRGLIIKNVNDV